MRRVLTNYLGAIKKLQGYGVQTRRVKSAVWRGHSKLSVSPPKFPRAFGGTYTILATMVAVKKAKEAGD
jgi:hypothetical protein